MTLCQVHLWVWFPGVGRVLNVGLSQGKALRTFLPTRMDLQLFFCGKDVAEGNRSKPTDWADWSWHDCQCVLDLYLWRLWRRMWDCLVSCCCLCLTFVTFWFLNRSQQAFLRLDEELCKAGNGCRIITLNCQWIDVLQQWKRCLHTICLSFSAFALCI